MEMEMELQCVHCGERVERLLVRYSTGNIRLMKCESCKAVADPYVECEFMRAYRHVLFNMPTQDKVDTEGIFWKACLIYFLADIFRNALLSDEWNSSKSSLSIGLICIKLLQVLCGNFILFGFIMLSAWYLLNIRNSAFNISRYKGIVLGILLSSYFKIFLVVMIVWEFPPSVIFIIDLFVISSNIVAFRVLTRLPTASSVGVLLAAYGAKFVVSI